MPAASSIKKGVLATEGKRHLDLDYHPVPNPPEWVKLLDDRVVRSSGAAMKEASSSQGSAKTDRATAADVERNLVCSIPEKVAA